MSVMWTMRDGTKIAIKDMSTSHILNTLKMLERNASHIKLNRATHIVSIVGTEDPGADILLMPDIDFLKLYTEYGSLEKELESRSVTD